MPSDDQHVLVCINCAAVVTFGERGWRHREPRPDCARVDVAWPPAVADDGDELND